MNYTKFNKLLTARIKDIQESLGYKSAEYASNIDKLHNFKRAGRMMDCSPQRALLGMWIKHLTSVFDIIDKADKGELPDKELWNEKIRDTINYTILLEAIIKEQIQDAKK